MKLANPQAIKELYNFYAYMCDKEPEDALDKALETAEKVEVSGPGRWEPVPFMPGFVRCSVCHNCNVVDDWVDGKRWNFCPECGADLRGEAWRNG